MENRLASTTTYPELLELGPGQWGQEGKGLHQIGMRSSPFCRPGSLAPSLGYQTALGFTPSLKLGHSPSPKVPFGALSRLEGGTWGVESDPKAPTSPCPSPDELPHQSPRV